MTTEQINQLHLEYLQERGVSSEVARERGYRSETIKARLRRLGFAASQCITPALVIPLFNAHREPAGYQLRPDYPRMRKDKPVKYETPSGAHPVIDVHPRLSRARGQLPSLIADPTVPLFITEGVPKADAAVSIGLCCIGLAGVFGWRGRNDLGGKTALADWEHVALNSRVAYIAFDSDVTLKREVNRAARRSRSSTCRPASTERRSDSTTTSRPGFRRN